MTDNKPHRYHLSFDLSKSEDARAWQYLSELDRAKYKSISQAIVTAVNAYFGHEETAGQEPPARSEQAEEQLGQILQKILPDALMQAMQQMLTNAFAPTSQGVAPKSGVLAPENKPEPKVSKAAMDFMASF